MTRTKLANMKTADICAMIGVTVTRAMSDDGFIVCRVTLEGCGHKLVDLRPSRVRRWLIDAAIGKLDNAGSFV